MPSNDAPQIQPPQDSPEAKRLAELQAQRLEYINPLEQQFLQATVPMQSSLTQKQFGTQIGLEPYRRDLAEQGLISQLGLQPQEAALRRQELGTAGQRQGTVQNLLGGQVPPGYEGLLQPLSPVSLTGQPYNQIYGAARSQIEEQQRRGDQQLMANQNLAGVLESGGTFELLRRSQEDTNRQLGSLSAGFMSDETNRLNQQALYARQAEQDLLNRRGSLLNVGLGIGPVVTGQGLQPIPGGSQLNPIGGASNAFGQAAGSIEQMNALRQQGLLSAQQLSLQQAANQNAFFGDIFGGLLGAGATLGGAALLSSKDYKENITNNTIDSIEVIKSLDIVEFDYKDIDSKHHIGIIVENSPEVLISEDGKKLDIMNVIGVLLDSNKKLIERVERLEASNGNKS